VALALALLPATRIRAQSAPGTATPTAAALVGVVVDSAGGAPVVAARVRLLEAHREDVTHDDGAFAIERVPAGTVHAARAAHRLPAGHAPGRPPGRERAELRVALASTPVQLATQVVTGTLTQRSGDETISPTSVVSGAELDRRVETTVAATLQSQPGVSVTSIGPATGRPVIRGLSGDRILVLEDGQRPGDLSSTSGDHAVSVDPLTATQIEVVRGPNSLLYGSSALGGVVNVVRDEVPTTLPDRAHGVVSAQGSSVNGGGAVGAYATSGIGPVAVRAEVSGRSVENVRTPVGRLTNTAAQTYGASAGAALVGDWGHAGASYRFYDNGYGIPAASSAPTRAA
jgi:iron complex outermembrane receptor protein